MAGNLVTPLLSLYGTEWRERGYGLGIVAEGRFERADLLVSRFFVKRCYHYVPTRDTGTHKNGVELYVALVDEIL